jgi:Ca2+-binding EF-hand superfamily protein
VKKQQVITMIREYDTKQTGKIELDDYMDLMVKKYSERDPSEEILRAFRLFDEDGRGKISLFFIKFFN